MMRLLDTNVLSELVRARPDPVVVGQLRQHHSRELFASVITRYELRYGASLRQDAEAFWARLQHSIMPVVTWLPVTQAIAERGGVIAAALRRAGRTCGDLDPLLAATALEHDLTLVTRNVKHFEQVPQLSIENWFKET
ncbi:MAG: type II toxin-antitoxin system VapC family toxin [Xanthomonadales bacterium]|nr:type II toxin-antitoxin system VapC family toxin [Xanthomonadales bacterium]